MNAIKLIVVFVSLVSILLSAGCSSRDDAETLAEMLDNVATNNNPGKITFTLEIGTWGRKATWKMEDIEWK